MPGPEAGVTVGFRGKGFPEEMIEELKGEEEIQWSRKEAGCRQANVSEGGQLEWGQGGGWEEEGQAKRPEGRLGGPQGQDIALTLIMCL